MSGQGLLDGALLQKLDRLVLASRRRLGRLDKGERRSSRKGSSLEFVDHRPYAWGDDLRQVDWNLYGRSGSLFVKLFEEEEVLTTHILLDVSRSMDWGNPNKLEYGRRLAAALGYIALAGYDRAAVGTLSDGSWGESFGPVWGRRHVVPLFTFLSSSKPGGQTDLAAAVTRYLERRPAPGVAVLISDLLSPTAEGGIKRLVARQHEVIVLHLLSPEEESPQVGEGLRLIDRESGSTLDVYLDQRAIDLYRERLAEWTATLQRFCARRGAVYLRLSTGLPLEQAFFAVLRRRGVLR